MGKVRLVTGLAVLVVVLFAAGLWVGHGVNQPEVSSLRAEGDVQRDEVASLQDRVLAQEARVAELAGDLAGVNAAREGLDVSLRATKLTMDDLQAQYAAASSDLDGALADLAQARTALKAAVMKQAASKEQAEALADSQRDLMRAIALQSELEELAISQIGPNNGDALLLLEEAHRAARNGNYPESAKYFGESSAAFEMARDNVKEATAKSKERIALVPGDATQTFSTSHRQSQSTIHALEAQARVYEGADSVYIILGEWYSIEEPSKEVRDNWQELANLADDQFGLAMDALDAADKWSQGLWRRTEAVRMNVRDWNNLLRGIQFTVIDSMSPPPSDDPDEPCSCEEAPEEEAPAEEAPATPTATATPAAA